MTGRRALGEVAAGVLLLGCLAVLATVLLDRSRPPLPQAARVSAAYLREGLHDTGAVNVVAAVLLDYRAFDTLGEATVIFAAATVLAILLGSRAPTAPARPLSPLVQCVMSYFLPFLWVFPVYVVLQGHLTPGGGFQGGVALAVLLILAHVTYGPPRNRPELAIPALSITESLGALGLLAAGAVGWLAGSGFLANLAAGFPSGTPGALSSAGAIPLLNTLIALKVAAALGTMYLLLVREPQP